MCTDVLLNERIIELKDELLTHNRVLAGKKIPAGGTVRNSQTFPPADPSPVETSRLPIRRPESTFQVGDEISGVLQSD